MYAMQLHFEQLFNTSTVPFYHACMYVDCPFMVLTGPSFCSHSNGSTQWEHPEITEVFKDVGESTHSWCMLDGYPDASGVRWSLPLWGPGTKLSACPHNQPTDLLNEDKFLGLVPREPVWVVWLPTPKLSACFR